MNLLLSSSSIVPNGTALLCSKVLFDRSNRFLVLGLVSNAYWEFFFFVVPPNGGLLKPTGVSEISVRNTAALYA
jgi:hypothetical protein